MAKKFGKFLLFTAAVGTAAVAAYYFLQKKDILPAAHDDDEDFDDFSDDLDDDTDSSSRNYVPLNRENAEEASADSPAKSETASEDGFTPLKTQVEDITEEKVEEFFDEDDSE